MTQPAVPTAAVPATTACQLPGQIVPQPVVTANPTAVPTASPTPVPEPTFVPFSTMVEVSRLEEQKELPDVLKFMDGSEVTKDNWNVRAAEIRDMYQYYMYGMWRNGDGETLNYGIDTGEAVEGGKSYTMKLDIETDGSVEGQKTGGKASFGANVYIPEGTAPEKGWPTFIIMGDMSERTNALKHGYAVISYDTADVDILFKYCDEMYNGKDVKDFDITDMQTSLFELEDTPSGINNKEIYEAMIPETGYLY